MKKPTCVVCGDVLPTGGTEPTWAHCSFCGKPVCTECLRVHAPLCNAVQWGSASIDPVTGSLKKSERPPSFAMD